MGVTQVQDSIYKHMANSRKSVVYLIAQPALSRNRRPLNLEPLYSHGEVCVVAPSPNPLTDSAFTPVQTYELIKERLKLFDPDNDFIVWAGGDKLLALLVGAAFAELDIWCYKYLRYERRRLPSGERTDDGATYVPELIDLTTDDDEETISHTGKEHSGELTP